MGVVSTEFQEYEHANHEQNFYPVWLSKCRLSTAKMLSLKKSDSLFNKASPANTYTNNLDTSGNLTSDLQIMQ